ncbi:MAG: helix-turn-helix domain-containing protein [Bacteroidetes bacterium]|nr:helix-turn-helix domain-containing protein [Bacteroidota bacterium]
MPAQILTTDDLYEFKLELLNELRALFGAHHQSQSKKWLKSSEVRRLLNISPGTLQMLRVNETLPYSKIGGTFFYDVHAIEAVLAKGIHPNKGRSQKDAQ